MPAGVSAYVPLANLTLTGSASLVTFTSISQSYRDLVLIVNPVGLTGTPTVTGSAIRINSDSGSNYSWVSMTGTGSSAVAFTNTSTGFDLACGNSNDVSSAKVDFLDYSVTDKQKAFLQRGSQPTINTNAYAMRWASTSAITSIQLYSPDYFAGTVDTWSTGSTFALYGVTA
jgi:hypothetical protein